MNHYPHHIGDFNSATRHISRDERWFYRDLIEMYYDYEKPLPDDFTWICRKLMATTEQEQTLVEQVLVEFFIIRDDGWHNAKCDEVLADYHQNITNKSNAGKASAAAKARKNKASKGNTTPVEQNSTTVINQKPKTINHSKDIADLREYLNTVSGRKFKNMGNLEARLKEGHSVDDVKQVIDYKVEDWQGTDMAKFIRPATLFQPSKFEGYLNDAKQRIPTQGNQGNQQTGNSSAEQVSAAIQTAIAQTPDNDGLADDG